MDKPVDSWEPKIDGADVEAVNGQFWPDGWISAQVTLTCVAQRDLSGIELQCWNPDWCAVYAYNVVSLAVDTEEVRSEELAMGELCKLSVSRRIAAGQRFAIRIGSKVARPPDALDARERALVVSRLNELQRTGA